jgi:segregation and condensation protein B
VPAGLQELADASAEPEEPKEETSFHTLLLELDTMEEGLKTDFDDILRDSAVTESEEALELQEPEIEAELPVEPEATVEEELEDDVLGVAEAREKLLAAVAALEQSKPEPEPELSDEEAEARALAEAIEAERREFDD